MYHGVCNICKYRDFSDRPVAKILCAPNPGDPGLICGKGTRSYIPQLGVHISQSKEPAC